MAFATLGFVLSSVGLLVALFFARKSTLRVGALERALSGARTEHAQKERLLQTVVENAPMAIVLYGQTGRLLYSNAEARELFFEGGNVKSFRTCVSMENVKTDGPIPLL